MADTPDTTAQCANCAKTQSDPDVNLKRCAKCHTTRYCSRECQKTNWKIHKRLCASYATSASSNTAPNSTGPGDAPPQGSPSSRDPNESGHNTKGLAVVIDKPFHRLHAKTWLHDRPQQDVFKLLIDTYRMRVEDDAKAGEIDTDSLYGGAADGRHPFRRFLRLAEKRTGLLPSWWSREKEAECIAFGLTPGWSSLAAAVEKGDIIEHYGSSVMPMQLRMFGEQVYKIGPWGQSGASMMQLQMQIENKELSTTHFSL